MIDAEGLAHRDRACSEGDVTRSWFQGYSPAWVRMFDAAGAGRVDGVGDVGGGVSCMVGALLERELADLTVPDLSTVGVATARRRLGGRSERVAWVNADVRTWRPRRSYRLWHECAVLHFMTLSDRPMYWETLLAVTQDDGLTVFGCFVSDGPERRSGLSVTRYDVDDLASFVGMGWTLVADARERHYTPTGVEEPFTGAVFRRSDGAASGVDGDGT